MPRPRQGTIIAQGTSTPHGGLRILPEPERRSLNLKIVAAISPPLFAQREPVYHASVLADEERWGAMSVTNRALRLTGDCIANEIVAAYSLASDWDDRWRAGGTVDEVRDEVWDEARLTPAWIFQGIERLAHERAARRTRMRGILERLDRGDGT
jgi:transketolase